MAASVLFLVAHPDLKSSRASRMITSTAERIEGVAVLDLYNRYPDFFVDGPTERRQIEDAAAIVVQAPIYWYGGPSLLKEWMDRTFVAGWAYGGGSGVVAGKPFLLSVTTGSEDSAWSVHGMHGAPVTDYLKPYEQFARFCGMAWQEPLILHGARTLPAGGLAAHAELVAARIREFLPLVDKSKFEEDGVGE